jgi:DNA-directed RNA polymerase specialized sigma24 family protein
LIEEFGILMATNQIATEIDDSQLTASVEHLFQRYAWRLLSVAEAVKRIKLHPERPSDAHAFQVASAVYGEALYAACCGDRGDEMREQAFAELHHYVYLRSLHKATSFTPEDRQDLIHDVILAVCQRLPYYRAPGAFLFNVDNELKNVLRRRRSDRRRLLPIQRAESIPDTQAYCDPVFVALRNDQRFVIQRCFRQMMRRHPRSQHQLAAVWLKFIQEMDDSSISSYFAKPIANIHVLRSRGMKQLRTHPAIQSLHHELER